MLEGTAQRNFTRDGKGHDHEEREARERGPRDALCALRENGGETRLGHGASSR
jgi:hypothetical protein